MSDNRSVSAPDLGSLKDLGDRSGAGSVGDLVSIVDLQPAVKALNLADIKAVSAESVEQIKAAIDKPKLPGDVTLKNMQTISKALSLISKLASNCDNRCKVVVDIVNNLEGVSLELVAQSDATYEECCGLFQSAPDAFIGPGSGSSILSSARNMRFDNCNGVIYRVVFKEMTFYLTIAWSFATIGRKKYYLEVSNEPGDSKELVKKVAKHGTTGVIDTSKKVVGSQAPPFKLKGAYSDPRLSIIVDTLDD